MKKFKVLLGVGVLTFGLMTGCGGSSETSESSAEAVSGESEVSEADITGDWVLTLIQDADGNQFTLQEYCEAQGIDASGIECTYNFDGGSTVTGAIGGVGVEGTYVFDGSSVTVTFDGADSVFNYDADSDIIYATDANSGMSSIMERQ